MSATGALATDAWRAPLRAVSARPLRVVDVAVFYGQRSGGIRTYLDAKAVFASRTGAFEHRLIVPGARRAVSGTICALPSVRVAPNNGYRWPLGARHLEDLLVSLEPDVVLMHDPFWSPRARRRAHGHGPSTRTPPRCPAVGCTGRCSGRG